jgi:WYL domain
MGNVTNDANWAAQERLRFIERCAWWRGVVNRKDLVAVFGVSMAQASADIQKYVEQNAGSMVYDVKGKKYDGASGMRCVYGEPEMKHACQLWLGDGQYVAVMDVLPLRMPKAAVTRRVMMALLRGMKVRVQYDSISGSGLAWREIMPVRMVNSGLRYHVRAWCFTRGGWRDFVLSRMREADMPVACVEEPPVDVAWEKMVEIVVQPHGELDAEKREGVRHDFAMVDGQLRLQVREALEVYVRAHLGLKSVLGEEVRLLEEMMKDE